MSAFPKLPDPVTPGDVFVTPATIDVVRAADAIRHAVKDGVLKPSDIDQVDLDPPTLLFVPFWQLEVAVDGSQPTGTMMVCARSSVPYEPKPPSFLGSAVFTSALDVVMSDLVPRKSEAAREAMAAGEVVEADLDKGRCEAIASGLLLRAVRPTNALYTSFDPKILSGTFVLLPLYYARYNYEGEARRKPDDELFVAVSGRSGAVVFERHPSAVRAVTNRLRKLLSFDRR